MIKKIELSKTNLSDLHQVFKYSSDDVFSYRKARLFPIGNTESELATASIFLATLAAVKEFREELLMQLGVNKIKTRNVNLHVYTELQNETKLDRPDGLIVITSGKHQPVIEWASFVEAKVGNQEIDSKQIDRYIEFGREIGINSLISISNEMVTSPLNSPVTTTKRSFQLYHWSWKYLSVIAGNLIRKNAVSDDDHRFILSELRRYIDSHKNLTSHNHMGAKWNDAVTKIHAYEPDQKIDKETLKTLVSSIRQEEKDISLQLTDISAYDVDLDTKEDRSPLIEKMLLESKVVSIPLIINKNKIYSFKIDVDFIRQEVRCTTTVVINNGKSQAQTTSLLKLLNNNEIAVSDSIFIKAIYPRNKSVINEFTLKHLLDQKETQEPYSILDKDIGDQVKCFEIKTKDLLGRSFSSPKNFIVKIENIARLFLEQVMSSLVK